VSAYIPKEHVFAVFLDREEHEIAVDPRRLRRLKIEPGPRHESLDHPRPTGAGVISRLEFESLTEMRNRLGKVS
jgi:hypothetical protein